MLPLLVPGPWLPHLLPRSPVTIPGSSSLWSARMTSWSWLIFSSSASRSKAMSITKQPGKAEPDLLRTKTRWRKWPHNKRAISANLSVSLPLRLTVLAACLDSRASPRITLCPVAAPDSWVLSLSLGNNFITVCWSLDLQASKPAKHSLKPFTEQNRGCSKGSAFQCLAGCCCLESHCTDWHILFFPQSHLIRAMLASQEAFSYSSRSQTD